MFVLFFLNSSSAFIKYFNIWQKCRFSSEIKSDLPPKQDVTPFPPLSQPVDNLPTPIYSSAKEENQVTQITVLPNGLKVASENRFGQFCTVGGM